MKRADCSEVNDRQNDPPLHPEFESITRQLGSHIIYRDIDSSKFRLYAENLDDMKWSLNVIRDCEGRKFSVDEQDLKLILARWSGLNGQDIKGFIIQRGKPITKSRLFSLRPAIAAITELIRQLKVAEKPPTLADSIICLCLPRKDSLVILGDLAEDYKRLRADRGVEVANRWYWRQALSAVWPLLQRLIIKLAGVAGVEEFVRHIIR
jgi:hypothetical protein